MWVESENNKIVKSWGTLRDSQHFWGYMGMLELRDETRKNDKHLFTHVDLHKTKQQIG
jgi:hypothetical protein